MGSEDFKHIDPNLFNNGMYLCLLREYWKANFSQVPFYGPITYIFWIQSEVSKAKDITVYLEINGPELQPHLIIGREPVKTSPTYMILSLYGIADMSTKMDKIVKGSKLNENQSKNIGNVIASILQITGHVAKRMKEGFKGNLNPNDAVFFQENSKFYVNPEVTTMPNNAEYGDQQTTTVESTESAGDKFKVRREVPIFDYPPSHYEHEIHNYSSGKSKKDKKREKKGKKVKSNKPLYRTPQANLRFAQGLINLMQNIPKLIDLNKPATTDDTYLKFTMETAMFTAVKKAGADYKMDTFNKFVKDFRKIIKHEPSIPKDLSMWEFLTLAKSIAHLMIGDIFGQGIDMQECVANLMKIGWLSPKLSWPHLTLPGLIFREVLWLGSFVNMRFMKIIPVYEQLAEIKLMDCKEFTFGMGTK